MMEEIAMSCLSIKCYDISIVVVVGEYLDIIMCFVIVCWRKDVLTEVINTPSPHIMCVLVKVLCGVELDNADA